MLSEAYLEITGPQGRRFSLNCGATYRIGRGEGNSIMLGDNQVSRNHAMVQCAETGEFYLTDLGSRNGTFVNQVRVTAPVLLQPGDTITIGAHEFRFEGPRRSAAPQNGSRGETVVSFSQNVITVLVVDIRDFTGLSRRLDEQQLGHVISAFTRDSGAILAECGAWGQKYIGDAVMALWVHQNDPPELGPLYEAVRALERLFGVTAALQARFGLDRPVRIGAGLNTGLACLGNMGSGAAADYTALSDAVNMAFRLESATKEIRCDIALGSRTYEMLSGQVQEGMFTGYTLALKGYQEPKPVFAAFESAIPAILNRLRQTLNIGDDRARTAVLQAARTTQP